MSHFSQEGTTANMRYDITNKRFGKLTALKPVGKDRYGLTLWLCKCDCGGEKITNTNRLTTGHVMSCGCISGRHDITGNKYGMLTAIELAGQNDKGRKIWKCRCDCGKEVLVGRHELATNKTRSCGCITVRRREGERIGRLTVLEEVGRDSRRNALWKCQCDCGNIIVVPNKNLIKENTKSCGCLQRTIASSNILEVHSKNIRGGTNLALLNNKLHTDNTSGMKGVQFRKDRQKWTARIGLAGKTHHLGVYDSFEEAAEARREAEQEFFDPILEMHGREPTSEDTYQKLLKEALTKRKSS